MIWQKHFDAERDEARYDLSRQLLGPIIHYYIHSLHLRFLFASEEYASKALFVTRAGVRIRHLYGIYLECSEQSAPIDCEYLFSSRLMVVKGCWRRSPDACAAVVSEEFANGTILDVLDAMYRSEPDCLLRIDRSERWLKRSGVEFQQFMRELGSTARGLWDYLLEQSEIYEEYVADLSSGMEALFTIDSGWRGTTCRLLQSGFPGKSWWALNFGHFGNDEVTGLNAQLLRGLVVRSPGFSLDSPESSIVYHRHIIEGLLEANGPSIECVRRARGEISFPGAEILTEEDFSKDALYLGVCDYICEANQNPSSILRAFQEAAPRLAQVMLYPSPSEAVAFGSYRRGANFGRGLEVPVLSDPGISTDEGAHRERMVAALWKQGQAALEFKDARLRTATQRSVLERRVSIEELGKRRQRFASSAPSPIREGIASVGIIVRTMDRPLLLRRALSSIASQTFTDYIVVVVCDGGDTDAARASILSSGLDLRRVCLVNNIVNRGMEAASNIGANAISSEFLVIHDDDDSWAPSFLDRCVRFLRVEGGTFGGVVTRSIYISEEVLPSGVKIRSRRSYNQWMEGVNLAEMGAGNFFPPISFLFRRSIFETLGGFDEELPVLGDWDFNLRFLLHANIGVIAEELANYHHRDVGASGVYGNSVLAERRKHAIYEPVVRNKFLRAAGTSELHHLGLVTMLGYNLSGLRGDIRSLGGGWRDVEGSSTVRHPAEAFFARLADERWFVLCSGASSCNEEAMGSIYSSGAVISPPPDFDEDRYLAENRDVAELVQRGSVQNGFEHFLRWGFSEGRIGPRRFG